MTGPAWALGPFGRHLAGRMTLYAAGWLAAGLALFIAFDVVESANADRPWPQAVTRAVRSLPTAASTLGKFALLLGGVTAGGSAVRRGELLAWFGAGGRPEALAAVATGVGGAAALGAVALAGAQYRAAAPYEGWLRSADVIFRVDGASMKGRRLAEARGFRVVDARVTRRWRARDLRWTRDGWRAGAVVERKLAGETVTTSTESNAAVRWLALTPREVVALREPGAEDPLAPDERRRLGLPSRRPEFDAKRRAADPVAWCGAVTLGLGLSLLLGIRAPAFGGVAAGLALGLLLYLLDEGLAASAEAALIGPAAGAWASAIVLWSATVAVWRTVLGRGIRD